MAQQFKFRKNIDIGNLDAEYDKYLVEGFVQKSEYIALKDITNPKSILIGRTGSGKTAMLKFLEQEEEHVRRINPEQMSLKYLCNSTILDYFIKLGVNLELFYKVLWKHVFIVELLKAHFGENFHKEQTVINNLWNTITNKKKKLAIAYLKTWETEFWEKTEYRIKEIENKLRSGFAAQIGIPISDLDSFIKANASSEQIVKADILHKAQSVVSQSQIEEISDILDIMKTNIFNSVQKKYYIVIDDLDKEWIDSKLVYDLIKSLIIASYEMKNLMGVKIIIAIRNNLFDLAFSHNKSRGVQREKYISLIMHLNWNIYELTELVNNRLKILMKDQYTTKSPVVSDILPVASKNKSNGFDYILDRTFMRPRDVIDFFNKAIEKSDGETKISRESINLAEKEYSIERFRAVEDEWNENYGDIKLLTEFLKGKEMPIKLSDIAYPDFQSIYSNYERKAFGTDINKIIADLYIDANFPVAVKRIVCILFEIGIIGIKKSAEDRKIFFYEQSTLIKQEEITIDSKIYVHPAFHRYFNIKDKT